jgi:lipopolysaccharide/colanic/teichoic acid biosynthesis glycosyltransferase
MTGASPGSGLAITAPIDPRITRLGRHLRRSRLDELPQLWDVVRGSMLLVGPRPEDPSLVDLDDPRWREVLSIPPGITGATQLRFHDEGRWVDTADPLGSYRTRILPLKLKSDLGYVRGRSARGDVRILLESVRLAFQREAPTHDPT